MVRLMFGEDTVLLDEQDLNLVCQHVFRVRRVGSAKNPLVYLETRVHGKTKNLHRLILGEPVGVFVDHINGNGLDNRRVNLRLCTHTENMQNRRMHSNNSSGVKGVYFDKRRNRFTAQIQAFGKRIVVGRFLDLASAATAYTEAAARLHGEFSRSTTTAQA